MADELCAIRTPLEDLASKVLKSGKRNKDALLFLCAVNVAGKTNCKLSAQERKLYKEGIRERFYFRSLGHRISAQENVIDYAVNNLGYDSQTICSGRDKSFETLGGFREYLVHAFQDSVRSSRFRGIEVETRMGSGGSNGAQKTSEITLSFRERQDRNLYTASHSWNYSHDHQESDDKIASDILGDLRDSLTEAGLPAKIEPSSHSLLVTPEKQ